MRRPRPGSPAKHVGSRQLDANAAATGAAFLLLGIASLAEAYVLSLDPNATRLHQTLRPGLYVALLGAVLVVSGIVHIWRNAGVLTARVTAAGTRHAPALVAVLVGYVLLIERLGYMAASAPFFVLVLRLFGARSWLISGGLGIVLTGVFYVLFVRYLGVILPRGLVEGIL